MNCPSCAEKDVLLQRAKSLIEDYATHAVTAKNLLLTSDKLRTNAEARAVNLQTNVKQAFHRRWTAAVGEPGYDKPYWMRVEALLEACLKDARQCSCGQQRENDPDWDHGFTGCHRRAT